MRVNAVKTDMPTIAFGDNVFRIQQSDGDIYHSGREVLARCLQLDASDPDAVLSVLMDICGVIDSALGAGAMKKIVGNKAVTLPMALKVINEIIRTCGERYAAYIRREYIGGKGNG